jgi:elongation factor 1 alpha-like protein
VGLLFIVKCKDSLEFFANRFKAIAEGDVGLEAEACLKPFSFADFFKDTPWLNIPADRQAIFIPPLYPRVGLLGGSSDGAPKVSKLQALAAARKKKAQEQKSSYITGVEKPMAGLNINDDSQAGNGPSSNESAPAQKPTSRGFPLRKRKDSNPHEKTAKAPPTEWEPEQNIPESFDIEPLDQATPSAFASTMFSNPSQPPTSQHPSSIFTLPYSATTAQITTDPFAGPSPDDVVIAAQSKGSTNSASSKLKK